MTAGNDAVSVIRCGFRENGEECTILAVNCGNLHMLNSQSYLQRHVIPWLWLFGGGAALAAILVNACCSRWISSLILPPMKEIRKGMQRVKNGEPGEEIRILRQDELGEVCAEFNEMLRCLQRSKEEQRKYESYRRELISGISHDLRTPLTTIRGYVGGILDSIADTEEKKHRYLLAIQTRTADLENLINRLSVYNKRECRAFSYRMEKTDLKRFVQEYLEENEEFLQENRLRVSLSGTDGAWMEMDWRECKRILDNLLVNSARYREKEDSRIEIRVERRADRIFWNVGDDGPGVPQQDLERIFESFCRLDESREHCEEGSGLGLAIVKRIVLDHGGSLYAKNRESNPVRQKDAYGLHGRNTGSGSIGKNGGLDICMEFPAWKEEEKD